MAEEALVEAYIRSDQSPAGKWWVEVPFGLSVQTQDSKSLSPKQIDAVCLTDHPQ